jgi:hypothetical protein
MFLSAALFTVAVAVYYGLTAARVPDDDSLHEEDQTLDVTAVSSAAETVQVRRDPAMANCCESSKS